MSGRPRSRVVGLLVPFGPDADHAGKLPFVETVAAAVREHDHDLLLVTADDGVAGVHRLCDRGLVDALVLMEVESHDRRALAARERGVPVVLIGVPEDPGQTHCVDVDFVAAGALAVAELAACGCRSAALFGHPHDIVERGLGYVARFEGGAVAEAARRELPLQVLPPVDLDRAAVDAALDVVLSEEEEDGVLPGLVLPHPESLPGVLAALADRGLVPGVHLAVVSLCTDQVAAALSPPLTSVSQEPLEVSRRAVEAVFSLLEGDDDDQRPRVELVRPRLTRRASTPATRSP